MISVLKQLLFFVLAIVFLSCIILQIILVKTYLTRGFPSTASEHGHFEPFQYPIVPRFCSQQKPAKVVIYVSTGVSEAEIQKRTTIRATWAAVAHALEASVVFVVGRHKLNDVSRQESTDRLIEESTQYDDILQANFVDSWDHLIHKWWAAIHYHAFHCNHIAFMVVADADTVVFMENFTRFLATKGDEHKNTFSCIVIQGQPAIRDPESRYFVPEELWPNQTLPKYCSGCLHLMDIKVAQKISIAVPKVGLSYVLNFRIFDVVTGLVADKAGIQMMNLPGLFNWLPVSDVCPSSMIALHGLKPVSVIEPFLDYRKNCCSVKGQKCPYAGGIPTYTMSTSTTATSSTTTTSRQQ